MMDTGKSNVNQVILKGKIATDPMYSHTMYGESFYTLNIEVPRLSGTCDLLPVTISDRLLDLIDIQIDDEILIQGQLRSYNHIIDGKSRLILTIFVRNISLDYDDYENPNQVMLEGYICREPVYRTTPFGREIADMLLAVNRSYNKSDYIPVIAWGRNARFAGNMQVGEPIVIHGRMQSRPYQKKYSDGTCETRIAYEVSASYLELIE